MTLTIAWITCDMTCLQLDARRLVNGAVCYVGDHAWSLIVRGPGNFFVSTEAADADGDWLADLARLIRNVILNLNISQNEC